ncbi:TetR/AcrR family transcriptional regulator [Obesumbacterium proteus]|uniref:HTH tetR-type domain-containing protein n=1 Tax=Obesumbacterium proteus ATCC 12841 TaxID=1354268 RepID=A0AA91IPK5_9GAMM|nr:TetR/AcrR family transcriptional regulator [Obesumbacterium proteus]AMO79672.1 hypothetical protein DSM2777_00490 [Obesumbacterium proteus]OAT58928.1 hypothetical protein M993_02231 [Obesumbacterium proteus ATCC 12841]
MKKKRMTATQRREQLLECALEVLRDEGADGLTLNRVAQKAGVTKPVVYRQFESRAGLLVVLYQNYCLSHLNATQEALKHANDLASAAHILAHCYIQCVLSSDSLSLAVDAALDGSASTEAVKETCDNNMLEFWEASLLKFKGKLINKISFIGFSGAAKSLSKAVAGKEVLQSDAESFLANLLL